MKTAKDIVLQACRDAGLSVITVSDGTTYVGTHFDPRINTLIGLMMHAVDKCQRDALEAAAKVAQTYRKLWGSTVEGSQDPGPTIADAIRALTPKESGRLDGAGEGDE